MPTIAPQKRVNDEAEKLKEGLTLPPSPAQKCKWDQAQAYFNLLTEEQKEMIKWYLYRLKPSIIKPKPFYIQEPSYGIPDEQSIISMHGGGNYRLVIQDAGKAKQIMEVNLSIPLSTPPKINLEELDMNDPQNRGYINQMIAEGKLNSDGKITTPNSPPAGTQTVPEAMVKMQSDFMNIFMKLNQDQRQQLLESAKDKDGLNSAVGQILIEKMKQDNPNSMMTVMVEMLKSQKSTASDFAPIFTVISTMMTQMVSMQNENAKALQSAQAENTKLILEMMKGNKEDKGDSEGGDIFDKVGKILEIAKSVKGGSNVERGTLEVVMDTLGQIGGPLLNTITQGFQYAMAAKSGFQGMPMPSANPGMPTTLPTVTPKNNNNVTEMPTPSTGALVQVTPIQQIQQLLSSQGGLIYGHLGNSGAMFADLLVGMYGPVAHASIVKFDDDTIINAAKTVPQFWTQVESTYGEPHFRKWLDEFRRYEEILAQDEEEPLQPIS
jgi:hypothetical protein